MKIFLGFLAVLSLAGCERTPQGRNRSLVSVPVVRERPAEQPAVASATPPSNVVTSYAQNLSNSAQKAKAAAATANRAIATTDREARKALE